MGFQWNENEVIGMKEIFAALIAAFLLFGCAGYGQSAQPATPPSGAAVPPASGSGGAPGGGTLFSGSQYASTAVQVYPGSSSGPSSAEVQGFDMAIAPQTDGSALITMTEKVGGQTLQATVPAGGSLYFNDANPGDDATGQDKFLQDDKLIVVDAGGYIVPA